MLRYAKRVVELTTRADQVGYGEDWALQLAMERALEIIGEAARKVSATFREAHPEIPWARIVAHRNFLAHDYGGVQQERVWQTATLHVPELIRLLKPVLEELLPDGPAP